jgi:hypothetical protein
MRLFLANFLYGAYWNQLNTANQRDGRDLTTLSISQELGYKDPLHHGGVDSSSSKGMNTRVKQIKFR